MDSKTKADWVDITGKDQSDLIWSLRRYDCPSYIFAEEYDREKIKNEILKTHRIKDAIEKYKSESGVDSNTAFKEAAGIIDEISHAFGLRSIRIMALMLMKITRSLFRHVLVNKDGMEMFRECAKLTPIVLVPTHNSYFDFLLASFICFAMDLPLPAIVSGQDFLNMAIVNRLLRGSGAFFMRRSFASDNFYKSLFTEYTQRILCSGERPVEFFPEGTRSRCGKALQPKLGLLSMVLESFFHGYIQDVAFLPVSISYEKITEEQLYLFELLGIPKPKESLSGLVKARSVLNSDFGTVTVHFGKPMYLKEYCLEKIDLTEYVHIPRSLLFFADKPINGDLLRCERHLKIFGRETQEMNIAKYFGEKVVFTQQADMVIFPRAVVSSLLLHKKQIPLGQLAYTVDKIGKLLLNLNGKLMGFHDILRNKDEVTKAVNYSDIALGIDAEENVVCRYGRLDDVYLLRKAKLFEIFKDDIDLISNTLCYVYLSSQRNKLIHTCILSSLFMHSLNEDNTTKKSEDGFQFLRETFKMEFIFDPDVTVHESFLATMNKLRELELLTHTDDFVASHPNRKAEKQFLVDLLQPFIDAYLIIMHCLLKNNYDFPLSLKSIASELQLQAAELVKLTHIETFESLSLHTLSNCVTSLCKRKLLSTVKNSKFETLVNAVDHEQLTKNKQRLARYATTKLRLFTEQSRL